MIGIGGTFKALAAISGLLFMGYCVYFDKKRRSDPEFKRKLHERRNQRNFASLKASAAGNMSEKDIEMYFMTQIHKGEGLITNGDIEGGVDHLINAILVCSQPGKLLQVLQNTLPMEIFTMMLIKMHAYESAERSSSVIMDEEGGAGIDALE
ncbi:mitochondrial import receptor subunit TOM20 homolog B [Drosophila elegans]|uniref:mitochondrial import receptor subunit TOM20 homolog B n=1 Tax=Drosophila elegans TaxID=30023 RepID=UPI0007E6EB61|nr:mitochondrial import receptor subunit TOM20 homolog B [Drosophila elegans]